MVTDETYYDRDYYRLQTGSNPVKILAGVPEIGLIYYPRYAYDEDDQITDRMVRVYAPKRGCPLTPVRDHLRELLEAEHAAVYGGVKQAPKFTLPRKFAPSLSVQAAVVLIDRRTGKVHLFDGLKVSLKKAVLKLDGGKFSPIEQWDVDLVKSVDPSKEGPSATSYDADVVGFKHGDGAFIQRPTPLTHDDLEALKEFFAQDVPDDETKIWQMARDYLENFLGKITPQVVWDKLHQYPVNINSDRFKMCTEGGGWVLKNTAVNLQAELVKVLQENNIPFHSSPEEFVASQEGEQSVEVRTEPLPPEMAQPAPEQPATPGQPDSPPTPPHPPNPSGEVKL